MAHWTVKQLAQEMGLQERTIIQKIHKGEIKSWKFGGKGKWLISSSEIDRLLGGHKIREDLVSIVPSVFEQNIRAHTKSVFNLLDAYARQLKVPYEPQYFLTGGLSLVFPPQLEMESSFAAVEGHYRDMELGKDISEYKQAVEAYQSYSLKLYEIIIKKAHQHRITVADTEVALEVLRKVVRVKLASVRFKLYLEGIETDREAIFETLKEVLNLRSSGQNEPLEELLEFVSKDDMLEESKLILELLERLEKNYEIMKRLEKAIIRDVEEEKLRGMLPPGTKCRFCPPASIEEA